MDPQDGSPVQRRDGGRCEGSRQPFRSGLSAQLAQERFARCAKEQRPAQLGELAQPAQEQQVVLRRLGETQARVERDALLVDPCLACPLQRLDQLVVHLAEDIPVRGALLHVLRGSPHVQ